MRNIHFLLLLLIFGIAAVGVLSEMAMQDPRDEAKKFLNLVRAGDKEQALNEFGDNTCHCAPKGGYASYFQYESGVDPNIAFLLGKPFQTEKEIPAVEMADKQPYLFPWDRPETFAMDCQVYFDQKSDAPYFLPMDTAFGQEISVEDLNKFAEHPEEGANRAFSLRVRPSLQAGFIPAHKETKEEAEAAKLAQEVLTPEMAKYLYPKDAGKVKLADGKISTIDQFQDRLPRLYSIVVRMYIVRRGQLARWTIKKLQLHDAKLITSRGKQVEVLRSKPPAASDLETPANIN